jgi:N-acyl-D-aspartate/D-glutamate deacylase
MEAGALGLSAGLFYAPGSYAKTVEVAELAKAAAAYGGIYDTHIRDESSYSIGVLAAVREAIDIARAAGLPLHISHIKVQGPEVWGKSGEVIAMIQQARKEGMEITADQYPYTGSGTSLTASLIPRWAQVGGNQAMLDRMKTTSAEFPRLHADMERNLTVRGGAARLLITDQRRPEILGKTLAQIAAARKVDPVEAALDIIRTGGAGIASINIDEADIAAFMKQDWVITGSDGSPGHPRKYGTFPRKLRVYVREKGIITLPFFVRNSTARTAEALHIGERGLIKEGWFADIAVFDYNRMADRATYEQPELLSTGIEYVLVNGKLAIDKGRFTGVLGGQPLRRAPSTRH